MFELGKVFQDLEILAIPTRTSFRGITTREVAVFRGSEGWSEFAPFIEYDALESKSWMKAALEAAYKPWPILKRQKIQINATLPKVSVDRVPEILKRFPGAKTIKIKVDDFESDADLVEAALDFNPEAKIRLDVNGGWDLKSALLNLYNYHLRFGNVFEYIEQPVLELADLKELKREIPMKIAVDESIRKALDTDLSVLKECADVAIIKWAPGGGFENTTKLINQIGLPVVISSALDTGIGISHGLALAAAQENLDYACGLATLSLLESDICDPQLVVNEGEIEVRRMVPDQSLVEKYRANADRRLWWEERISNVIAIGGFDEYFN
jgi:O-succinylbenzoate synthase